MQDTAASFVRYRQACYYSTMSRINDMRVSVACRVQEVTARDRYV